MKTIATIIIALILGSNLATAQDTIFVYKAGSIAYQQAVSNIDSITFKRSIAANETGTDIDGNVYKTITLGTQTWMAENLKTTRYRNGESIPYETDWAGTQSGARCFYNHDANNGEKFGQLYNGLAVTDFRNIAPKGWHVPTDAEWLILTNYVSEHSGTSTSVAKALASTTDWNSFYLAGTPGYQLYSNNFSGFNALPAGYRDGLTAGFLLIGMATDWWSSTVVSSLSRDIFMRSLQYGANTVIRGGVNRQYGLSVRCVKD